MMQTSLLPYHLSLVYVSLTAFVERVEAQQGAVRQMAGEHLRTELAALDLVPLTNPDDRRW